VRTPPRRSASIVSRTVWAVAGAVSDVAATSVVDLEAVAGVESDPAPQPISITQQARAVSRMIVLLLLGRSTLRFASIESASNEDER
jgi:hypothetical protein